LGTILELSIFAFTLDRKTDLKRVRLETLKKEEGAQFAHPVPSEKNHYFENPLQEGFCGPLKGLRTNDRPSGLS
jgi:hypothetical protein